MKKLTITLLVSCVIFVTFVAFPAQTQADEAASPSYDIIIENGLIVDGTGAAGYAADIAISGDTIAAIGDLSTAQATRRLDAKGHVVSPGFIDLHSHSDRNILDRPDATNNITQGVTTLLGGNCGGSPVDMAKFMAELEAADLGVNMAMLIGHNSVRRKVMQRQNRHATDAEMQQMIGLVNEAMDAGAFGISTGLIYIPGAYSPPEETQTLASVVHKHGGFYASHMRNESKQVLDAVRETVEVSRKTGIGVHISHHKAAGPGAWGMSKQTLALIDKSRAAGLDVTLDQYPYTASNTNLGVLFPSWALAGGKEAFMKRMNDPQMRQKIKAEIIDIILTQRAGDELWRIQISRYNSNPEYEGKTFADVLKARGLEPTVEQGAELAIEMQMAGGGRGIYHNMNDEDVERIMRHPQTAIASDGCGVKWQSGNPHPRSCGTYPRSLAMYVRDKGILTIEQAVQKMTTIPAQRMKLTDRGQLKVGLKADIAVWDPETIQDRATFTDPHHYSIGMKYVIVNGVTVLNEGMMTENRPGIPLKFAQR